jgi:hypothetical protein
MALAMTSRAASVVVGLLLLASTAAGSATSTAFVAQDTDAGSSFAVRADPRLANKVNAVLARLAREVEARVPEGMTAEAFVSRLCGGRRPPHVETVPSEDGSRPRVRFSPCLSVRKNVELVVDRNNTLAGFAARNGLTPEAVAAMTIKPGPKSEPARVLTPETLRPDDRVVIPEVSAWTPILTRPEAVRDRSGLVSALATGIGCGEADAETCLKRNGVAVLERGGGVKPSGPPEPPPPRAKPDARFDAARAPREERVTGAVPFSPPPPTVTSTAPAAVPPAGPPGFATPAAAVGTAAPPFVDAIPIAKGQWPYDAKLLAAILERAAATNAFRPDPVIIGIAEGGLAGADGAPLSGDMFASSQEDSPEPDDDDDDCNGYLNDLLGAGPYRLIDHMVSPYRGTGDIGLCQTGPPLFSSWDATRVELASHGAIVATLAAGRPIRVADARIAAKLPKVTFFRMLDNVCAEQADFDGTTGPGDLELAFEYLENRSQIINISYSVKPEFATRVRGFMKDNLMSSNKLLVLPAGNDSPGNLDAHSEVCPACLGSPDLDSTMVKRTVVVGAASRDLRRQGFSNYGTRTVWIYAPGEPTEALDVRGQDATTLHPATSYAAPYASLAAGIMWSLGIDDVLRVKERLDVATWPLFAEDDGRSHPEQGGVLDLVKAAAVRLTAIDVKEPDKDGTLVRKTYVGTLVGTLNSLELCAGRKFFQASTQSLRFETSALSDRQVRVYPRDTHNTTRHKWKEAETCRSPDGSPVIRLRGLDGVEQTFKISDVMQIQLPWTTGS